ncbi:MAG TPA: HEPN domain-containing protein, partial [Dongiaceae bacterium]|nr:HEPN domain-containing protein [Dongiaceae bacterium]
HLKSLNNPIAKGFSIKSPLINSWYQPSAVDVSHSRSKRVALTMKYRSQASRKWTLDNRRMLELSVGPSYSLGEPFKCHTDVFATLTYRRDLPRWDALIADIHTLEMFFYVASGRPLGPTEITLTPSKWGRRTPANPDKKRGSKFERWELLISQSWYKPCSSNSSSDRTIRLREMKHNTGAVLSRWFKNYERLRYILPLYRYVAEDTEDLEIRFMTIAQAMEALHREFYQATLIPPNKFAKIKTKLLAALPRNIETNARKTMVGRIGFINEAGLTARLSQLINALTSEGKLLFPNFAGAAGHVSRYRNAFTHVVRKDKFSSRWVEEVNCLSEILKIALEMSLLHLSCVTGKSLQSAIKHNWHYILVERERHRLFG